ncbi:MAG TPA: ribosome biogenesis GTP-binding protein YihA/YsxC [Terriglobales bacterium]|jgi:GTP-binding protein
MRVLTRFLLSATNVSHFPEPGLPEIAFLGRSNVGKSSVINSLLGTKIAKTSSTPGRTQAINFFEVRWPGKPKPEMLFADLPGYGYSRVPRDISAQWSGFIDPYLTDRPSLALCLVLVDPNVPPQENDKQLLKFLQAAQRPTLLVATKSDRLSSSKQRSAMDELANELGNVRIVRYSSKTGAGREELWQEIRNAVADFRVPELGVNFG